MAVVAIIVHTDRTDDTDLKSFKDFYYRRNKIREFCEICVQL